jgi:hypothetical protein
MIRSRDKLARPFFVTTTRRKTKAARNGVASLAAAASVRPRGSPSVSVSSLAVQGVELLLKTLRELEEAVSVAPKRCSHRVPLAATVLDGHFLRKLRVFFGFGNRTD